ncbi:diaminopimelate decarboxylase [Acetivibrio mesophilus]|uniref:Diaminopimelate decarboxylase n=1 Tax=Acetivibrio mesophilus TaxID=2487273 RepID=A0A4Q0I5Q6_9FIRM|nr:diaminopimelate decarboxylase [Acetivibrio mesophilus]ODM26705.1 diaminopimelate decarboxylase [Clostridium sp. Bc-iso-3]RXE58272.1 diaminopimelate decarboxylase [Acetivibrio mesophilus]HHV30582.1 diaminopimelate decarboxylase [Clostridium sp.]HOA79435.1 diaminopimelate decarboxylase [Defluviitaleaceae bacterium]
MTNLFISKEKAYELIEKYGSPLYVYNEDILKLRCSEMKNLMPIKNFRVNFSAKANGNLELLKIVKEQGVDVDAMSPGEIFIQQKAGFPAERIFYIGNNVSADEMKYAIERNILVSVDSLSQLELFGKINAGGDVAVRFNPGMGAGHHEKVVTAGKKTKFGVQRDFIPQVKDILKKYNLNLVGINQHIGSLFLEGDAYIESAITLLSIAKEFENLRFVDFGGGFGVPYKDNEGRLDLAKLGEKLKELIVEFVAEYENKDIIFKVEPGRYLVAECCILLGEVYSVKDNYGTKYVGTDLGFNVLSRPVLYNSYHEVAVISKNDFDDIKETVNIVGNICESGDIIAKDRELQKIQEGDIIAVLNAGAYGYAMASNYNCRLRPAEVLICSDGTDRLIRRRDTLEDLIRNFEV